MIWKKDEKEERSKEKKRQEEKDRGEEERGGVNLAVLKCPQL